MNSEPPTYTIGDAFEAVLIGVFVELTVHAFDAFGLLSCDPAWIVAPWWIFCTVFVVVVVGNSRRP